MKIETIYNNIRYTLSNDNLKVGDKAYPIANGRIDDNDEFVYHEFDFRDFMCGFPNDPHTIKNLNYSSYKPYEVHTDKGWSPKESYFKIVKREKQVDNSMGRIKSLKWVEIK